MGSTVDEVLKLAIDMVKTAENLGLRIILFPTDASRAEADHYKKMISEVITAGKIESVTFVDTIGGCCTQAIPHIINFLKSFTSLPLEVHFHNDFGLATANTIAALTCGVSTAHTTVLGIGERSGNAAFEQVVMILKTMFDKDLSIKYEQISDLCRYVSKAANFPIPTNRPFVGEKIFEIECLENLMGYLNSPQEIAIKYTFPYHWDVVGHRAADFSAGAETSEELFEIILKALNLDISSERKQHILKTIQQRAISEKHSFVSNEIINLVKKS
jgi:isopropylmalate/homocitrate/citramalate synthase